MNSLSAKSLFVVLAVSACGVEEVKDTPTVPLNPQPTVPCESCTPEEVPDLPVPEEGPELFPWNYSRFTDVDYVNFDTLVANPDSAAGRIVETRGVVRASCQARGCWMEVRSSLDASSQSMTVRFKDYSFFVPLDSRSADVRFQGQVQITRLTSSEVAHYESEGYTFSNKEADGSVTILEFTAIGVEMWRRK